MSTRHGEIQAWLQAALTYYGDECLTWPFSRSSSGYGDFRQNGEHYLAHRFVCESVHGPAPDFADAAHSCHNKLCCNPSHLRWATRAENMQDKEHDGTAQRGEQHPSVRLTAQQVAEIRAAPRAWGIGAALARRFGVHPNTVYAVRDGRSW